MTNTKPKRTRPRDGGAIAVVAAVALVALIGMAALVVDGGYLAVRRRGLQGVTDAAALAGGFSLPTSATAIAQAKANATANGYTNGTNGATVTVNSPYSGDSRKIEVIVQTSPSTFLGTALRINSGVVKGRAVATLPSPPDTVFAGDNACSTSTSCSVGLCINGTGFHTTGSVHSNGSLTYSGDATDSMGATEYATGCTQQVNGPIAVASGPTAVAIDTYPLPYTSTSNFSPCTYSKSGTFDVSQPGTWWKSGNSSSGGVLNSGVYCATGGGIQLNGSNITGSVTFVCDGVIQISGQSINLTSYMDDVFLFTTSTASPAVVIGSYNLQWEGAIFAPYGAINISGTQFTVNGSIIGKDVFLGATTWTMTGTAGTSVPYLTE